MNAIDPKALFDKIEALPLERRREVADFVEFIAEQDRDQSLVRAASEASVQAFAVVWSNPEDDVYDAA